MPREQELEGWVDFLKGVMGSSQLQLEDQRKWAGGDKELRQVLRRAGSCHIAPYISWHLLLCQKPSTFFSHWEGLSDQACPLVL